MDVLSLKQARPPKADVNRHNYLFCLENQSLVWTGEAALQVFHIQMLAKIVFVEQITDRHIVEGKEKEMEAQTLGTLQETEASGGSSK